VRAAAAGDAQGVFGPRSVTWQIDRESAIFFGAGRALLLQLAHPSVAAAIEQHSNAFADPVGRFHRTFSTVFAMVFGTLDQSMSAARRLHRRHASNGPSALDCWTVHGWLHLPRQCDSRFTLGYATLIETALVAYELILPAVTLQQREQYYRESRSLPVSSASPRTVCRRIGQDLPTIFPRRCNPKFSTSATDRALWRGGFSPVLTRGFRCRRHTRI
jgi:hypothetical protein